MLLFRENNIIVDKVELYCLERRFLKYYKKLNPEGKIISINLQNTDYLSDDDLILIGDVQQVFQKLTSYIEFN